MVTQSKKVEAKVETKVEAGSETKVEDNVESNTENKINPIAAEATAPKAEANASKIDESKKEVQERKEKDAKRKPTHSELMASMQAQTKKRAETVGNATRAQSKPRSFPDPNFKPQ